MSAPHPLADPFEHEVFLSEEPRVLSFSPRAFSIPLEELLRHLAFDLVGGIPKPLGQVEEDLSSDGPLRFRSSFAQVGPSVLAIATEIEEREAQHRVLELLGVKEDVRLRLNMTQLSPPAEGEVPHAFADAIAAGRPLGQVRIWGNEPTLVGEIRRTLARQILHAGIETKALDRHVIEPVYRPPAAGHMVLESMPSDDLLVVQLLLDLLARNPVEGSQRRAPRQISTHNTRVRRKNSIVSYAYETHRAGTGVLHMRRREVEAGHERPGLVRTFVLAGLQGAARLRIRDVGGRVHAEFAGAERAVEELGAFLERSLGGRA